jgi:hypothetical protein
MAERQGGTDPVCMDCQASNCDGCSYYAEKNGDTVSLPSLQEFFRPPNPSEINYSCNACLRVAERHNLRVGSKLNLRGRSAKVIAINHELGDLHCLLETAEGTLLLPVREAKQYVV